MEHPATTPATEQESQSGIITLKSGERHIPASQRADGSKRREIKIRPGYKPPEDVATYKNRTAEGWRNRGTAGAVPGSASVEDTELDHETATNKAKGKNAKRREARKKAKAAEEPGLTIGAADVEAVANDDHATGDIGSDAMHRQSGADVNPPAPEDEESTRTKQGRKIQKKLRQAQDLKAKQDGGQSLRPEQLEKVASIDELLQQLERLDVDGGEDVEPS